MPLSDEEFEKLKNLWAEAYLKLTEMGQIIGKNTKTFDEKLGMGGMEVTAIIKRKDGSVRETRNYKFKTGKDGEGKLQKKDIKTFPEGVK